MKFESYAFIRIQGTILDAKRKSDWVPRSVRGKVKEIQYVAQELEGKLRREPTTEEMAEELNMSVDAFISLQGRLDTRSPLRLDQEDENGSTLGSMIPSQDMNPEEQASNHALIARMLNANPSQSLLCKRHNCAILFFSKYATLYLQAGTMQCFVFYDRCN